MKGQISEHFWKHFVCIGLCTSLFLQGCIAGETKTTTKTTTSALDNTETVETTVTETTGAFESENLVNYYKHETARSDNYTAVATKKIDAIMSSGKELMANCETTLEKALAAHNTQMQVASVPAAPPSDGIAPPKTMADYLDKNMLGLLNTGINAADMIWGSRANESESSSMVITSSGSGSVFVSSNGNSQQEYSLTAEGGETGTISGLEFASGLTYTPTSTSTETQGDTGLFNW